MSGAVEKRKEITETVFNSRIYDFSPPETVVGWIAWLQEQLELVPVEYRADCRAEFRSEYEGTVNIEIGYPRPETDAEMKKRVENNARKLARNSAYREQQERALLAELKARYEGGK